MPFVSSSQKIKCYTLKAKGENGSWDCDEWNKGTPKKLPKHIKKKKHKKYQFGGTDDSSDFFNTLADAAIQQQQPQQEEYTPEQPQNLPEEDTSQYDDLKSQLEELKSQLESQQSNYDPTFNTAHKDDEFLNFLFADDNRSNEPVVFDNTPDGDKPNIPYNPASITSAPASYEAVGEKELEAFNFFKGKGLPDHVAAGIVGNLKNESGLDTNARGDGGKAYGLAQWHPDRLNSLKAKGHDLNSFKGQLEAVYAELNTSERGALNSLLKTTNPSDAARVFDRQYERSAGLSTNKRINSAASIYNRATGKYQAGGQFEDSVMMANSDLNFVKRYLHPKKYPVINNSDGTYSTHMMESADNFAYPTIIQNPDGSLKQFTEDGQAYDYAMKNKQYIKFKTEQQAMDFANNGYKKARQYQIGGIASTPEQQYDGLNDPSFDHMMFPLKGTNTFRGLDNEQPVLIHDETGKQMILKGKNHTSDFKGRVYELKL